MTKEEVAARAGLTSRYLWRVEAGLQSISMRSVAAIAVAIELTLAELVEGVELLVARPIAWPVSKPRDRKAGRANGDAPPDVG